MPNIACVCVHQLATQSVLRAHPTWRGQPVAIIDRAGTSQATLLEVNRAAQKLGVHVGMRLSSARNLAAKLHAEVFSSEEAEQNIQTLTKFFVNFSPEVEASDTLPGVFWLNPQGLDTLYGNTHQWGQRLLRALRKDKWLASMVIGFDRHATQVLARTRKNVWVMSDPQSEQTQAMHVPLSVIAISAKLRHGLTRLGVYKLGDLACIPLAELKRRLGAEAAALYTQYIQTSVLPLQPSEVIEPVELSLEIDPPDDDLTRLIFRIKQGVDALLKEVRTRAGSLRALHCELWLDHHKGEPPKLVIEPATPTLDSMALIELVRLRLSTFVLPAKMIGIKLHADITSPLREQLALFEVERTRQRAAADRALARVRALYGANAVTRAELTESHLPESSFQWTPIAHVPSPKTIQKSTPAKREHALVRRLLTKPTSFRRPTHKTTQLQLDGPFRVSTAWWQGADIARDYYFVTHPSGDITWVYYDPNQRRWFEQGSLG